MVYVPQNNKSIVPLLGLRSPQFSFCILENFLGRLFYISYIQNTIKNYFIEQLLFNFCVIYKTDDDSRILFDEGSQCLSCEEEVITLFIFIYLLYFLNEFQLLTKKMS